jgi:hypothetical protein
VRRAPGHRDARYAAFLLLALLVFALLSAGSGMDVFATVDETSGGAGQTGLLPGGVLAGFPGLPMDLNTASIEDLVALPGIGERTAAVIIAMRAERGAFESVDELGEIRWMRGARLARLHGLLTVLPEPHLE